MKIQDIFIGRPVYWALAGTVTAVLAALGLTQQHVRNFLPFQFTVLALAIIAVAVIMVVYRPGERATREPLDPQNED